MVNKRMQAMKGRLHLSKTSNCSFEKTDESKYLELEYDFKQGLLKGARLETFLKLREQRNKRGD